MAQSSRLTALLLFSTLEQHSPAPPTELMASSNPLSDHALEAPSRTTTVSAGQVSSSPYRFIVYRAC